MREFCYKCWRVQTLCLCSFIIPKKSQTEIVILQHPNEKKMPYNTARLAHLCLENSKLMVGIDFENHPELEKEIDDANGSIGVLFPSELAKELSDVSELKKLIVIDGTWSEARKLVYNNKRLKLLPQYQFTPEKPSNYRIRKEPQENFISSIEAIVQALRILEKNPAAHQHLLDIFDKMVDRQVDFLHINPRHQDRGRRVQERKNLGQINWLLFSCHPTHRLEELKKMSSEQVQGIQSLATDLWGVPDIWDSQVLIPRKK